MKAVAAGRRLALPRVPSLRFVGLVAAAPILVVLARALPPEGLGLAIRLAAAAACVLVLPGALVVRALGWPSGVGLAAAAAVAWSLVVVFAGLAAMFATGGSLLHALVVGILVCVAALVTGSRASGPGDRPRDLAAPAGVAAAGVVFGAIVWWTAGPIDGDALFHLARARKLAELDALASVETVNEFRDGGLHPGYAFPLWHGAIALVASLGGVDTADVVRYLPAVLVPLAFLVTYGAGAALFRSWEGGVAAVAAQAAHLGFARGGTGVFAFLSLPPTVTILLLVPAVLALAFTFFRDGDRALMLSLAAAALAVAVIHPTYAIFVAVPLAGFVLARLALVRDDLPRLVRGGVSLAAIAVPSALFFVWLLPIVRSAASHQPAAAEKARALAHYASHLDVSGESYRLAPEAISRAGAPAVAALLAIPLAAFAARRLWAAFVLGGSLAVLAILLFPPLFTTASDLVSLSQARRLAGFLPLPFALAGAALVLARLRAGAPVLALAAGIALQALYPGELTYKVGEGGPAWAVWFAAIAGAIALVGASFFRRTWEDERRARWGVVAVLAFATPVAVAGFSSLESDPPDPHALTPGVVDAVRRAAVPGDVVFADLETSYRVAAYASVYVVAAPLHHVADTKENRGRERADDVARFFWRRGVPDVERRTILGEYGADWLLVDKTRRYPEALVRSFARVYEDDRYLLVRAGRGP